MPDVQTSAGQPEAVQTYAGQPEAREDIDDTGAPPLMRLRDVSLWYDDKRALDRVSFDLRRHEVLGFIGPSGCGKTTALKCLNRMHDGQRGVRIEGLIEMEGHDIHAPEVDPPLHRRRFGWVAQRPNPFPATIWENVAYGARIHGIARGGTAMVDHVEDCLRRADLWDEVKDDLRTRSGLDLSGGQQQRLCIARALSTRPDVLLMDEPTGSVDPVATDHIEALIRDLRARHSIVIVTHSMMQARRVADRVAHFHLGRLIEIGPTRKVFGDPDHRETKDFVTGVIG